MIIKSLLDIDLYKISMQQFAFHRYPHDKVEFKFFFRNKEKLGAKFTDEMLNEIEQEIMALYYLRFTDEELKYLKTLPWIKEDFLEYLKNFNLMPGLNVVITKTENDNVDITIRGTWRDTILYEIYILAIVNEIYFKYTTKDENITELYREGERRYKEKIAKAEKEGLLISEFGTRRRFAGFWQEKIVCLFAKSPCNVGTSNLYLAMKYGLNPIGTVAHEYTQFFLGKTHPLLAQKQALKEWVDEYKGLLGIALTDTFRVENFMDDFLQYDKMYAGVRHDSGDPIKWGNDFLAYYKGRGINPKDKTFVFSDGLDIDRAIEINKEFEGKVGKIIFGIGTNLTNDLSDKIKPLNIVIKMTESNGIPTIKMSDDIGKQVCKDEKYKEFYNYIFNKENK